MLTEIRKFDRQAKEVATIQEWWRFHGEGINPEFLSDFGYMCSVDGTDVAALFLFPIMGSRVAWISWPISSPDSTKEQRDSAFSLLFARVHTDAAEMKYSWIVTMTGHPGVQKRLRAVGYHEVKTQVNEYWRKL